MTQERKPAHDMLGRPIEKDDYVVSYNNIYQITDPGRDMSINGRGFGTVTMILVEKSKTTRPVRKRSHEVCKIDRDAVLVHLLTKS